MNCSFFKKEILLFFLLFNVLALNAQDNVFDDPNKIKEINNGLSFFEDTTESFSFNEILNKEFIKLEQEVPNLMVSQSVFWVKFKVKNKTTTKDLLLELGYPILDNVELYQVENNIVKQKWSFSELNSFDEREIDHQNFIFNVTIKDSSTFYLKVQAGEQILLPISLGTEKDILERNLKKDLLSGIYFGVIIVMLFYNFFLFLSVKDKSYLFYVIYIFSVGLTQATLQGYSYKFLVPDFPWLSSRLVYFSGALSGIASFMFVRVFLQTKVYIRKIDFGYNILTVLYLGAILLAVFGLYTSSYQLIDLCAGIGSLYIFYTAILLVRKGHRAAKFFLFAWSIFLMSVIVFVLRNFNLLPYNMFTNYVLNIGSGIEVVLLSFALADRINILKREKESSQAEALQMAQENERIIREQNIVLEQKVNERTVELQQSNEELNATLENLKETQAQLVDSEKMASLGQLTAGIAHEINNPINFVTSNITPLKHDVADIMELIEKYDEIKGADGLEEKLQGIKSLKEEIDLDYLKTEIESLLKGIQEGAERTSEIVRGLKNFSRLDEDDLKKASINEGIESTLTILNNKLKDNITVDKEFAENSEIDCYPGKINQLLMNIINNSVQAIEAKKDYKPGEGLIKIKTETLEKELLINISDDGIGMDESTKKKVFDPFYTTKDVGKGTGLGMSIVYNIIQSHHGRISIDSEVGRGTSVSIFLPIKATV